MEPFTGILFLSVANNHDSTYNHGEKSQHILLSFMQLVGLIVLFYSLTLPIQSKTLAYLH